jgi:hypothetical protein
MALTPNLSTVIVGGQYVDVTGSPVAGQVRFTPRPIIIDAAADQIIIPRTVTVDLDANGEFTVVLPVTDDPDVSPIDWTYRVEEAFPGGRLFDIQLPEGSPTINLADVSPAVPSTGDEASLYVLLSVFNDLADRVTVIEGVTTVVQGIASDVASAVTASQVAAGAALDAERRILHPFVTIGI